MTVLEDFFDAQAQGASCERRCYLADRTSPFAIELLGSAAINFWIWDSGTRSNDTGTWCGRSSPLAAKSRCSRKRMRVVLIPTKTAAACELRRSGPRPSKRTVTCGRPSITLYDSTVPGHHLPLPKRTIHTHTGAPGESCTTSDGSISSFTDLPPASRSADLLGSQFECGRESFMLNFDFAWEFAA
jgi:hypothetical protein